MGILSMNMKSNLECLSLIRNNKRVDDTTSQIKHIGDVRKIKKVLTDGD